MPIILTKNNSKRSAKMTKKELIKHYNNILHCPDLEKYPEKEDYLKKEIQQLADIDKISYQSALAKIHDVFFF